MPKKPGGCNRNHIPKTLEHLTGLPNLQPSHEPPAPSPPQAPITLEQSSKLKKWLGHLLATNWRNIVARCKFSVASLYGQNNFQVPLVESV